MYKVVIVGGGPGGVSALYQLVKEIIKNNLQNVEIVIIEKSSEIGPGLPYATPLDEHILNLPANIMSINPDKPSHFIDWIAKNYQQLKADGYTDAQLKHDFPPRHLFGRYLKAYVEITRERAKEHQVPLLLIPDEEVCHVSGPPYFTHSFLTLKNSKNSIQADQLILAIGHLPPDTLHEMIDDQDPEKTCYFHQPWPTEKLKKIPKEEDVIIAGTRLTAIDIAFALIAQGHKGTIHMASRTGLLPCVLGAVEPYTPTLFTLENILAMYKTRNAINPESLGDLLRQEINVATGKETTPEQAKTMFDATKICRDPEAWLRREIDLSKQPRKWQTVLWSIYGTIPFIWRFIASQNQQKFFDEYYSVWMTYLASFPCKSAEKLLNLMTDGRVKVHANLDEFKKEKTFAAYFKDGSHIAAPHLINATGPGLHAGKLGYSKYAESEHPLLACLARDASIVKRMDPCGGQLSVDQNTLLLANRSGDTSRQIRVIGDLLRPAQLATTDMGAVATHAKKAVTQIIAAAIEKAKPPPNLHWCYPVLPDGEEGKKLKTNAAQNPDGSVRLSFKRSSSPVNNSQDTGATNSPVFSQQSIASDASMLLFKPDPPPKRKKVKLGGNASDSD